MNVGKSTMLALAIGCTAATFGEYSHAVEYSSPGEYEIAEPSTDVTLTGEINGDVTLTLAENCRVTLSNATLAGTLTINGDADLWLAGDSDVSSSTASAISCSGALTVGGDGTLSASAAAVDLDPGAPGRHQSLIRPLPLLKVSGQCGHRGGPGAPG